MDWDFASALIRLLILLPIVAGLAYVVIRYGLGRMNSPITGKGAAMKVVDRLPTAPKSAILVIRVSDRYFLMVQNENRTDLLRELESYPEDKDDSDFKQHLAGNNYLSKLRSRMPNLPFIDGKDFER